MSDIAVLERLHALLRPRSYLQIGLDRPELMALARCGAIGVAPSPRISEGGHAEKPWLKLYAMEPVEFLAQAQPEQTLEREPLDLVLIEDGRPLPELARTLDALARWSHPNTHAVVLADETGAAELARLAGFIRAQCPALQVRLAAEDPAGLLLVTGFGAEGDNTIADPVPAADRAANILEGIALEPRSLPAKNGRRDTRDAVLFAWWTPDNADAEQVGAFYLRMLRTYHSDSKVFVGINHGTAPPWIDRLRTSGLDIEVRSARSQIDVDSDVTGFLAALDAYRTSEERFGLVWFGHTKGASHPFAHYEAMRIDLERRFWSRRAEIGSMFADPVIGLYASHFCPLPAWHMGAELPALLRIYRDRYAPLGLHCRGTFYVMREEIVRGFCATIDEAFFCTDPRAYGADRWFFEIGFPSVASMQGYEPFIDPDVPGDNNPRDDVWLAYDVKQNHRIANAELKRWRADRVGFHPKAMEEQLVDGSRLGAPRSPGEGWSP